MGEPDVNAHQAVPKWDRQISDLPRWMSAHLSACMTAFQLRKWKRWNKKRWASFLAIVLLLVGGVVGGIFGGLDIAQNDKSPQLRMPPGPDGSRVVVPWESSAALVFDPLKVRRLGTCRFEISTKPLFLKDGAPPGDGNATECNTFYDLSVYDVLRSVSFAPNGLNQSIATFTLNQNASSVFIHTEGDASTGMVQIVGSDDRTLIDAGYVQPGTIRVDVVMRSAYNQTKALVCKMKKPDGGEGVGVYVSERSPMGPSSVLITCGSSRLQQRPNGPPTKPLHLIPIFRLSSSSECLTSLPLRNSESSKNLPSLRIR